VTLILIAVVHLVVQSSLDVHGLNDLAPTRPRPSRKAHNAHELDGLALALTRPVPAQKVTRGQTRPHRHRPVGDQARDGVDKWECQMSATALLVANNGL
jgi:hypothetical protein